MPDFKAGAKLAIGTAQFGMSYGIANKSGQVSLEEGMKILTFAKENGVDTLDTASGYGDGEKKLGDIGVEDFQVISKLSAMPDDHTEIAGWVEKNIYSSLEKLHLTSLYGLLLHRPGQLQERNGILLYKSLQEAKARGLVKKIGISIYSPDELDVLLPIFDFDIVQTPLNVFDRRIAESGWLDKLAGANIEIHVRSVFLQGLLLMTAAQRPGQFKRWDNLWSRYDDFLKENRFTPLEVCLNHVLGYPQINKVIVGVDSLENIQEIISAANLNIAVVPKTLVCNDLALIDPSKW